MVKKGLILGGILVAVSGILVSNTFAESANTDFNIKVNPSLSLSVSSSNVGFSLTPTQTGSYDSASFNVYSSTNNPTGYKLIMSTNKVDLESNTINPTTGTKPTIPTLAETQEGITAAAFEASTSSDVLNHWGVSVAGANYNVMKSTQEIKKTTVNNVTVDTTAISLASKLDLLTVPGVYSTTINFQLVANMYTTGGSIGDDGRYPANSLLRAFEIAYTQAGKPMYIEDSNTDIGWRPMVGADFDTVGGKEVRFAMQDISMTFEENGQTKNVCEWASESSALVMDLRDGTSYNIIKAKDDRCWLADNLALNLIDTGVQNRTTPENTNATKASLDALFGVNVRSYSSDPTGNLATAGVLSWTSGYGSLSGPLVNVTNTEVVPQGGDPLASEALAGGWKTGVFYNFCAASAGSFCYGNGGSNSAPTPSSATEDICPAGWRLPNNYDLASNGEIYLAVRAYPTEDGVSGYNRFRRAFRIPLAGKWSINKIYFQGQYAMIWSSTNRDTSTAWYLMLYPDSITQKTSGTRGNAHSVRCIAK